MKVLKRFVLTALFAVFTCAASAEEIHNYHSGLWYDEARPGHGLSIEVLDADRMVAYWYAYHPDGTPMWLEILADVDGDTATGEAYHYSGMRFGVFDPLDVVETPWGTVSITFEGCSAAHLIYDSPLSHGGVPFGTGEVDLVRLTYIDGLECPVSLKPGLYGNYTATFVSPVNDPPAMSSIMIHENGEIAYEARHGNRTEAALGRLWITGDSTFEFEVDTASDEEGHFTSTGIRKGSGTLDNGFVTLDLGELGILSGALKTSFFQTLSPQEIAGTYFSVYGPLLALSTYRVYANGLVDGDLPFDTVCLGSIEFPNSERNQLRLAVNVNRPGDPEIGFEPYFATVTGLGEFNPEDGSLFWIKKTRTTDGYVNVSLEKWSRDYPW
jgi:hypothetical protein